MGLITAIATATTLSIATVTSIVVAVVSAVISMVLGMIMSPSGGGGQAPKDKGVRQRIPTDPKNKLGIIYGNRKQAGQITMADISSDDQTLFFIISLAEGPCEGVTDIFWADKKLSFGGDINSSLQAVTNAIDDNGDGDSNDFLNGNAMFRIYPQGGRCEEMERNSSKWRNDASNRNMPNTCFAYVQIDYDRDNKVTGLEQKLFFFIDGRQIRTFDTSGTLSTSATYSKNPSECLLDYLTDPIFGCNVPDADIDMLAFYRYKKFCEQSLDAMDSDGVAMTTPRYELNGLLNPDTELDKNVSELVMNGGGWFTYNLGRFGVIPDGTVTKKAASTLATSDTGNTGADEGIKEGMIYIIADVGANGSFTSFGADATPVIGEVFTATRDSAGSDSAFTGEAEEIVAVYSENKMYGPISITGAGFENIVNRLTIKYPSTQQAQQEEDQLILDIRDVNNPFYIDPLSSDLINADEPLLEKTISMVMTNSNIQAQRIGAININNSRQNLTTEFKVDLTSITLQAGDVIAVRHSTPGWGYDVNVTDFPQVLVETAPKLFRVVSIEEEIIDNNIALLINAQEYTNANYVDGVIQERDAAPNTNFPSPNRPPDIGSITVRDKIQEYSFMNVDAPATSLELTIESGTDTVASGLTIGRGYIISNLGNTIQTSWLVLAGSAKMDGTDYAVGDIFTAATENTRTLVGITSTRLGECLVAGTPDTSVDDRMSCAALTGTDSEGNTVNGLYTPFNAIYYIEDLGTTPQGEWNTLVGTTGANYVGGSCDVDSTQTTRAGCDNVNGMWTLGSSIVPQFTGNTITGTGTVETDAGTGILHEQEIVTVPLGTAGSNTPVSVASAVATHLTVAANSLLVESAAVDTRTTDTIRVTFDGFRAGDAVITAADTVPGFTIVKFDNATLAATDNGVSSIINGIPVSGLSVSYRDDDPFLDRVEFRWFNSSDPNISMDPADGTFYIGRDRFQVNGRSVLGESLIGNSLTTNNSPFEILELNPESAYQIDVRGLSYLGSKTPFIRLPPANTDSLASLYTAVLTSPTTSIPAEAGNAGTFSAGGQFQVFAGNMRVISNVFYSVASSSNIPTDGVTIDSAGLYEVTQFASVTDEDPASAVFRASVVDSVNLSVALLGQSGTDYTITSVESTSQSEWNSIPGYPVGTVPFVGLGFVLTQDNAGATGNGTVARTLVDLDRTFEIIKVVDPDSLINLQVVHEVESAAASNVYVAAPNFFKDNNEFSGTIVAQTTTDIISGHNYTIISLGGDMDMDTTLAQARWNQLAGTTGVVYGSGTEFFARLDGSMLTATAESSLGVATTSERNYRLRAIVLKGNVVDPEASTYEYTWLKDGISVVSGVGILNLEINASDIDDNGENAYRVVLNTSAAGSQGSGGQTFNESGTLNSGLL